MTTNRADAIQDLYKHGSLTLYRYPVLVFVKDEGGEGRVPDVVEKGKGVFSRYPKNNWLMG